MSDDRTPNAHREKWADTADDAAATSENREPLDPDSGDDLARATVAGDGEMVYGGTAEGDEGWLYGGLGTTMLLVGVVLFLFPEPATSALGIGLMVAGIAIWLLTVLRE